MTKTEIPEAYRIGWVPFIHTKIYLDSHPLIPRTETEYWVNEVIQRIKSSGIEKPRILDLCAGSGCIGVAVAYEIPGAQVDLVELDTKHHETIRKNLLENGIDLSRVRILGGDLFENVSGKYDFILSNPPYIDMSLNRSDENVLEHEPHLALNGGEKGMEIIDRILNEFSSYLNPEGALFIEHEPEQAKVISRYEGYKEGFEDQFEQRRYSIFNIDIA